MTRPLDWDRLRPRIAKDMAAGLDDIALAVKYRVSLGHIRRKLREWRDEQRAAKAVAVEAVPVDAPPAKAVPVEAAPDIDIPAKPDNSERNSAIIKLAREGLSKRRIRMALASKFPELTLGVIAGVVHRAGLTISSAVCAPNGVQFKLAAVREKAQSDVLRQFGELPRHKNSLKIRPDAADAPTYEPSRPMSPDLKARGPQTREEIINAHIVTVDAVMSLTGCCWPYGDQRDRGITFCNRPRCRVRQWDRGSHSWVMVVGAYCSEHKAMSTAGRSPKPIGRIPA